MSTIVCFGDSNTWGYDPATATRLRERALDRRDAAASSAPIIT